MDILTAYDATGRVISYSILMEFRIPPLHLPVEEVQLSKEDIFVFLTMHHSRELFHLPTLMHNSFIH